MPKYLSGRVKRTPQGSLTTDRYQYLGLDQAEPNLGDPLNPLPNPPGGSQFQIISVREKPGERFWIPLTGGIQPGSITVREEGTVVPPSGINSTTDVNFKGAAITVTGFTQDNGFPGTAVTVTVSPPGEDHGVLFNNEGEFATSPYFTFDNTTGIGSVGIGTTAPIQNLHVVGNVKLDKTIYGENNEPGSTGDLLVKTATGGVVWTNQNSVEAGAGGTIGQIQFHGSTGLVDGADKFYYDFNNDRVGIGSTIPDRLLDVLGNSRFTGVTTFVGFTTFTDDVTFTTANAKNIFFDKSDDSLKFGDGVKARFGDSQDLSIYHTTASGGYSAIVDEGTGQLVIGGNIIEFKNAALDQNYAIIDGSGIDVTGHTETDTLKVSGISTFVDDVIITGVANTAVVSIGKTDNLRLLHNSTNGVIENNYGELIFDGKSGGAIVFKTSVSQVERLRIHSDGKVQINGDDVSNIFSGANDLIVGETTQSSEKGITIANNSSASIRFNDGSDAGIIEYVHPYNLMKFSTDETERLTIDGSGSVNIIGITTVGASLTVGSNLEVNGNILPKTHKGGNIGESGSFSWNKIYADEFIGQIQTTQENLEVNQLKVAGISTFVGIATFGNGIHVQSGVSTFSESVGILTDLYVTGIATFNGDVSIGGTVGFGSTAFFGDDVKLKFGDTDGLEIYHSQNLEGTNDSYIDSSARNLYIRLNTETDNGGNIALQAKKDEHGVLIEDDGPVKLYFDGEKRLETTGYGVTIFGTAETQSLNVTGISTFNDDIFVGTGATVGFGSTAYFRDNAAILLGDSQDLRIYHDSVKQHSYIQDSGTGDLVILSNQFAIRNADETEDMARFFSDGSVVLRHKNAIKFETSGVGVTVTGLTDTDTLLVSGISTLSGEVGIGSNLSVAGISTFNDDVFFNGDSGITSIRFDKSAGSLKFVTNAKAVFGADGGNTKDLEIYSTESHSYIKHENSTNGSHLYIESSDNLILQHTDGSNWIRGVNDGATELYWNATGSKKLATSANGIDVTGNLLRTGTGQDIGASGASWDKVYATEFIGQVNTTQENLITGQIKVTGLSTFMDDARFEKDVLILGTLTYDDVTNIDSVGLVTARSGVRITQGGLVVNAGVSTFSDKVEINSALSVTGIATFISNVGIGTDAPGTLLELKGESSKEATVTFNRSPVQGTNDGIIGEFLFENNTDSVALLAVKRESAADDAYIQFATQSTGGGLTEKLRITSGGNIGIGTTDPDELIEVRSADNPAIKIHNENLTGWINIAHRNNGDAWFHSLSAGTLRIGASNGAGKIAFYTDGMTDSDEKMRITNAGNVNIGGNYDQTTYKMRVTGTVAATHFDSLSDLKLKTNVKQIQNPIETVKKIDGVTFNWKEDNDPSMGVIAQNIEEILPEIVSGDDVKSVNYSGLIGLLIETVKDQQKQIDELRGLIDK